MRLGITGGIACGKSFVLNFLGRLGFEIINSDALVDNLLRADADVIREIGEQLGGEYVVGGVVDKERLGKRVFEDDGALGMLEEILHGRVIEGYRRAMVGKERVAVELPLLFELNLEVDFDVTICVSSCVGTQGMRARRRGWTDGELERRSARQLSLGEKERRADFVIVNEGSEKNLYTQLETIIHSIDV